MWIMTWQALSVRVHQLFGVDGEGVRLVVSVLVSVLVPSTAAEGVIGVVGVGVVFLI
jgi:hypothetical protein